MPREVARVVAEVLPQGKVDARLLEREQFAAHGFAWIATTVEALAALSDWSRRGREAGRAGRIDELVLRIGFGEYLSQLIGGVPMSQNEFVRPRELGLDAAAAQLAACTEVARFLDDGNVAEARAELAALLQDGVRPDEALDDDTLDMVRDQFRSFAAEEARRRTGNERAALVKTVRLRKLIWIAGSLCTYCTSGLFFGAAMSPAVENLKVKFQPPSNNTDSLKMVSLGQMPLAQETVAMYFCLLDPKTPLWVKGTVAAALAYFILPLDAVPDLLPIVGLSDDAGVLAAALSAVSAHITDEHRARARGWMTAPIDVTPNEAGQGAS